MNGSGVAIMRRYGPWATLAAGAVGIAAYGLPPWAIDMTKLWGPGFLMVLAVFAGIAYYVPRDLIKQFFQSHKDQAVALTSLADAVKNLPQRDEMKFESVLIGQEMLSNSFNRMDGRLDKIKGLIINGQKRRRNGKAGTRRARPR